MNRLEPFLSLTLDSSMLSVRATLSQLRARLAGLALGGEAGGAVELVLAEVLNNICEHAYRDRPGHIQLTVWNDDETLIFEIGDQGAPMPLGRLPAGHGVSPYRPIEDLPEGGFGWNLIRQLTSELSYARVRGRNELTFRMRRDAQTTA